MPWDAYEKAARASWQQLLGSGPSEADTQDFLERNPSLVPGWNEYGAGHHGPHERALYTQPQLKGLGRDRYPDFMWITADSATIRPVFIEIEDPRKRYFLRNKPQFTAEFSQAHGQLNEWKAWWADGTNQATFRATYLDPIRGLAGRKHIRPLYVLVFGRRSEFDDDINNERSNLRSLKQGTDEVIMTFDRLRLVDSLSDIATVRMRSNGRLAVKAVAECYTTGPFTMDLARRSDGATDAFGEVKGWSSDRAAYVAARWTHWRQTGLTVGRDGARTMDGYGE